MANIHLGRVLVGGLLAGLIVNLDRWIQPLGIYVGNRRGLAICRHAAAIQAGLVTWLLAIVLANVGPYLTGFVPARIVVIDVLASLLAVAGGTVAGAYLYRESPDGATDSRARAANA